MDEENELDSMQGISDEKMTDLFNASIEIENEISRLKNVPIARYDVVQKKAYFERSLPAQKQKTLPRLPKQSRKKCDLSAVAVRVSDSP